MSKTHYFTIKFDSTLKLSNDMTHEMAVNRISMKYSWHNMTSEYESHTIKYSADDGVNRETITFVPFPVS